MLQSKLDEYAFSCGAKLTDLESGEEFPEVYVCQIMCYDPIERLYYSAGYPPICVYCGEDQTSNKPELHPQCKDCQDKEPVKQN